MDLFTGALIAVIAILLYYFLWGRMTYFKNLGIPHKPPNPYLGNMAPLAFRQISMAEYLQQLYNDFPGYKYFGFYRFDERVIVLRDPELVSAITVKHFDHFTDHRPITKDYLHPELARNLFSLRGDRWREVRKVLTPSFSSSKMKIMYTLMHDCAVNFADYIAMESKRGKVYDMKALFGRYTADVIATCAFGISVDSMKNPNNEFYIYAKDTLSFLSGVSYKLFISYQLPIIAKIFGIRLLSDKARSYFRGIVADTVKMRKEQGIYRPDMIQLMMETRVKDDGGLSIDEMTYHAFNFFVAGYEATSTFLCFVSYVMSMMPEVQAKLRAEIEEVVHKTDGRPTYEAIKDMQYMDAVLHETLRIYPILAFVDRVCVKEFQLPPAAPGMQPVTIKPGGSVWYLPFVLQRDPAYFPDPLKFKPERFLNREVLRSAYMPFGVGPRMCIGNRFSLMKAKVVLFHLLLRCDLEPCADTPISINFQKLGFIVSSESVIKLSIRDRKQIK